MARPGRDSDGDAYADTRPKTGSLSVVSAGLYQDRLPVRDLQSAVIVNPAHQLSVGKFNCSLLSHYSR